MEKPGEERHEVGPSQEDEQRNQAHKRCLAPVCPPLLYRHDFMLVLQSHLVVCCVRFLNVANLFKKPDHLIVAHGSLVAMKHHAFDHAKENQSNGPV